MSKLEKRLARKQKRRKEQIDLNAQFQQRHCWSLRDYKWAFNNFVWDIKENRKRL